MIIHLVPLSLDTEPELQSAKSPSPETKPESLMVQGSSVGLALRRRRAVIRVGC